jgi:hypothetical protein
VSYMDFDSARQRERFEDEEFDFSDDGFEPAEYAETVDDPETGPPPPQVGLFTNHYDGPRIPEHQQAIHGVDEDGRPFYDPPWGEQQAQVNYLESRYDDEPAEHGFGKYMDDEI